MGAFRELLQEKVPVGAPIMKTGRQPGMERPRPAAPSQFLRKGENYDLARPACHLLSNGLITALCTDFGSVSLSDGKGEAPILTLQRERYAPAGLSFFYRDWAGKLWPLTAAPCLGEGLFSWAFDGGGAAWRADYPHFSGRIRLSLPRGERGALWSIELE